MLNEIKSFKKFHAEVESKLCLLEDTTIAEKEASKEITNDLSGFIANFWKDRISSFENEIKSKDTIIEYLTKQLLPSNSKKPQMESNKCNLNETFNDDKSFYDIESSDESKKDKDKTIEKKKRVVIITGDSMLNEIHEKGMSKNHRVKLMVVKLKVPGGTSATILENINQLVKSKPDCLIVHTGANDLANRTNLLNQAKKNS